MYFSISSLLCLNNCEGRKKLRDVVLGTDLPLLNTKSDSEDVQYGKSDKQSDQKVTIEHQPGSHAIRVSEQSDPGSPIYAACQYAEQTQKSHSSRSRVQSNPYASPYEELQSMSRHSGDQSNFEQTNL